jgi:hypothetical protein
VNLQTRPITVRALPQCSAMNIQYCLYGVHPLAPPLHEDRDDVSRQHSMAVNTMFVLALQFLSPSSVRGPLSFLILSLVALPVAHGVARAALQVCISLHTHNESLIPSGNNESQCGRRSSCTTSSSTCPRAPQVCIPLQAATASLQRHQTPARHMLGRLSFAE